MLLQLIDMRHDFVVNELPGRFRDHPMFFGEILRREDLFRSPLFDQERATFDDCFLFYYG